MDEKIRIEVTKSELQMIYFGLRFYDSDCMTAANDPKLYEDRLFWLNKHNIALRLMAYLRPFAGMAA